MSADTSRDPIEGTWAGLKTWRCPLSGYTVAEEPGVDAYTRVRNYTESMFPVLPEPDMPPDKKPGTKRKETA